MDTVEKRGAGRKRLFESCLPLLPATNPHVNRSGECIVISRPYAGRRLGMGFAFWMEAAFMGLIAFSESSGLAGRSLRCSFQ